MSRIRMRVSIFVALGGLAGAMAISTPSQAAGSAVAAGASSPVALTGSAAPKLPAGAVRLGAVSPASTISLDVTLNVPDQSALNEFIAGLSDRNSPLFHHFLGPGQFGPMFGPSLGTVIAVESALKSAGLSPGQVASDRLSIPVTATAGAIDHAFGIELVSYRLSGGRVAYANSAAPRLPSAIAPLVQGVLGLNNLYPEQSAAVWPSVPVAPKRSAGAAAFSHAIADTTGPQPCTAAKDLNADGTLTANQLAEHYLMSPLYSLGDLGKGVHVALYELEPNLTSDISEYESCYGIKTAVNYTKVDGGPGSGAGEGEAALDIEDVAGLAPDATLDVYQAPNTGTGAEDGWQTIINDDKDQVVSSSWGECEDLADESEVTSMETLFQQAATQGQSVFAAIGDSGSTGCLGEGVPAANTDLSVWTPASSPLVMAVGGTTVGSSTETVWNESKIQEGAGGGGLSDIWCMPSYQYQTSIPGLINKDSQTNSGCSSSEDADHIRQVPDVSADADPSTGYAIFYNGNWLPIGGTSAATPLWAAIAALTDASPFCADYGSGHPGVLSYALYEVLASVHSYVYPTSSNQVPEVLFDVTSGNNDYTPSGYTGGLYPAGKGFDEASGLGVPLVSGLNAAAKPSTFYPGLTALMCAAFATKLTSTKVTSVAPSAGPAGHSTTVTVHGSGFLPIAGADMAVIGSTLVPANCTSTTACKVTVPAKAAGTTINIQISAEDFTASAVTTADRYRYVAAPSLSSSSPARGPAKGGNTVTIHGTNFIGVTAVHFGKKLGTHVKDVSATEVKVTAPAGSGTVHVTVTAAGGTTSSTSTASKYQYVAAPGVSSLSPARGPAKGGTKVTIHGTSFIGVTAVHFGKKLASHLKVVSATEITVTAPAGSGTVHVTVTAVGGTSSSSSAAGEYHYT
jgi:subtilase family serine protease